MDLADHQWMVVDEGLVTKRISKRVLGRLATPLICPPGTTTFRDIFLFVRSHVGSSWTNFNASP